MQIGHWIILREDILLGEMFLTGLGLSEGGVESVDGKSSQHTRSLEEDPLPVLD